MRAKRTLVPRTRESINRQMEPDQDQGGNGTIRGDYTINPKLQNVRYDRLRCYKGGKTVIRIWNMLDPEQPGDALLNGRLSTQQTAGLGGMSISEPATCVQFAGLGKEAGNALLNGQEPAPFSYIIARNRQRVVDGISFWDEPYVKLYVTAKKARDMGEFGNGRMWDPRWNQLMAGQYHALSAFKSKYFVVASVYENGPNFDLTREHVEYTKGSKTVNKDTPRNGVPLGEAPNDPLVVLQLPVSAGSRIFKLANKEKQDWTGDETVDPSVLFTYGDPCGRFHAATNTVKGGLFFTLYNPDHVEILKHTTFTGSSSDKAIVEYEVAVSTKYEGPNGTLSASLNADQVDNILAKHLFFWKESDQDPADSYLLHEPSLEERCVWIAKGFRTIPKLLEFSWMSNPEYLNFSSVRGILNNRTSVVMPAIEADEEDAEPQAPPARRMIETTAKRSRPAQVEPDEDFEEEAPVHRRAATSDLSQSGYKKSRERDDEFEVEAPKPSKPKSKAAAIADEFEAENLKRASSKPKSKAAAIADEFELELDEDAEEEIPSKPSRTQAQIEEDDDYADDDELEETDDEESEDSEDFNSWDDEAAGDALTDQLNNSMAKAKGLARSQSRPSSAPEPAPKRRTR